MKSLAIAGAMLLPLCQVGAEEKAPVKEAPTWLWPPPQRIEAREGNLALNGLDVLVPDGAGRRVAAIAEAVARYVRFYHKVDMQVRPVAGAAREPFTLLLAGRAATDAATYAKLAGLARVDTIPQEMPGQRMWRRESYVLEVRPQGAALAAPEIWGLLQGARTLMQMARAAAKSGGDALASVSIVDWPDMPERVFLAIRPGDYFRQGKFKAAAALAAELKYTHMMFALYGGMPAYPLRPEHRASCPTDFPRNWADYVRSLGVPTWPWMTDPPGAGPSDGKGGGSIVYYLDTEEFYQIKFEMMDHVLDAMRPDAFHVCMSEQYLAKKRWNGSMRTKEQYIVHMVELANFLLRRGVTPSIWGDNFMFSMNFEPREQILNSDPNAVRRIPREVIIGPWQYANRERYEFPWETLASRDFGFRAMNSCAWWGTDGSYHAQHMTRYGKDLPLLWGLVAVVWDGPGGGLPAVNRCAGSLWNCRLGTDPKEVVAQNKALMAAAPYDVQSPDFLEPLGLQAMLWREPNRPVAEYVARLANDDPLVWEDAREELVGFGAGGAAEILRAMAESPAIEPGKTIEGAARPLRWKLEGALSRICRDGRHGEATGQLDTGATEKFLSDPCPYVRDMAAELIASCAPRKDALAIVRKGIAAATTRMACMRAAGVAAFRELAEDLIGIVRDARAATADRTAAARYLAHLKPAAAEAGGPLLAALKGATDSRFKKELIRTLALAGFKDAEDEMAANLDKTQDKFVRIRAVTALVNLKSSKAGDVESWLAEDDRAIVEVGCWALGRVHGEEAVKIIQRNIERQQNPQLKQAMEYQVANKLFLKW